MTFAEYWPFKGGRKKKKRFPKKSRVVDSRRTRTSRIVSRSLIALNRYTEQSIGIVVQGQ